MELPARITVFLCLSTLAFGLSTSSGEPTCYSRFDYDHKMMTSLVNVQIEQAKLSSVVQEQAKLIDALKAELSDFKTQQSDQTKNLEASLHSLNTLSTGGSGTTFVRWGRTLCPGNGTELVYDGYVGGSHYTSSGGAANHLCLPKDPLWGKYKDGIQASESSVYGAEFENSDNQYFFGKNLFEQDVPCAVCRTKRTAMIMIPARNHCYDGWTLEYSGYLQAGHETQSSATEFVCMDASPEILDGGSSNNDGRLFYMTEAYCGALRCPPYVHGRELTCCVCSK